MRDKLTARQVDTKHALTLDEAKVRPDDSLEAESNLSDKRHEAEDTTPKDTP